MDLYECLGLSSKAESNDITKAYRKLARELHPDRNPSPEAKTQFQKIDDAYKILSDPQKRKLYDQYGLEGLNHTPFSNLFNGQFVFQMNTNQNKKVKPLNLNVECSLKDLYMGITFKKNAPVDIKCSKCKGKGTSNLSDPLKCNKCGGIGMITTMKQMGPNMFTQSTSQCNECSGVGIKIPTENRCTQCKGSQYITEIKTFEVKIPPGFPSNREIIIEKQGHQFEDQIGNVVIRILEVPNFYITRESNREYRFVRENSDLHVHIKISLYEAITGFSGKFMHLDGREIPIKIETVITNEYIHQISGEGMPNLKGNPGNLYIHFNIIFPKQLVPIESVSILNQ